MQHSEFNTFLTQQLNDQQKAAATQKNGSLLIIAGAGSGKTRVITARITHLIMNEDVQPEQIVALTFTNKAAMEMKERITHFLGTQERKPFVGTFHSYCLKILKSYFYRNNQDSFTIIDEDDKQKILTALIQAHGLKKQITSRQISYRISQVKNRTLYPNQDAELIGDKLFADLYHAYEHEKSKNKSLDFDDLLLETLKLFIHDTRFKEQFQSRITHVLVDEYQDTNVIQDMLLRHMTQNQDGDLIVDSVCAVGDADQSIYSWRGATVENIENFTRNFKQTTTIKIEQNYRSMDAILTVANTLIEHNNNRNKKNLWSTRKGNDCVRVLAHRSGYQEAESIASLIQLFQKHNKTKKIAVLYRTHFQSRAIEEALLKESLTYTIIGGIQFYERKEIKDILGYLRLFINPFDRVSFFRIINTPSRGLGNKFEELFRDMWDTQPLLNFKEVGLLLCQQKLLTPAKEKELTTFLALFTQDVASIKVSALIEKIIHTTHYIPYLKDTEEAKEAQARIENINELINAVRHIESQKNLNLIDFLYDVALMQAKSDEQNNNSLNPALLMTIHAAKGLEFDTVIIAGLEEELLPSSQSLSSMQALEEERRLFYVGITRAKDRLLICHAHSRHYYGNITNQLRSRFLHEITATDHFAAYDATRWNITQTTLFFQTWLGIAPEAKPQAKVYTFSTPTQSYEAATPLCSPITTPTTDTPQSAYPDDITKQSNDLKKNVLKKNQMVKHAVFGIGMIKALEQKKNTNYATVAFKNGTKQIEISFLTAL